jgi:uncharacterized protein
MPDTSDLLQRFLDGGPHAVVGASPDRAKYGNKVLRSYQQSGREVYPVHPREKMIEGLTAYPDLAALPAPVHGISVIVPPAVSLLVVEQAAALGITHVWLQPGAEDESVLARAAELELELIAGGPCILVAIGYSGS